MDKKLNDCPFCGNRVQKLEKALKEYADEGNWFGVFGPDDEKLDLWIGYGNNGYILAKETLGHSSSDD